MGDKKRGISIFLPNNVVDKSVSPTLANTFGIIHEAIDTRRLPEEVRIKHNAVGQCLRSLIELLDNELRASEPTP